MRMLFLGFFLAVLLAGCGGTHLKFHHSMKEINSFWMTVHQNGGPNGMETETAQLFYCVGQEDGSSKCKQTDIERCENDTCQFDDTNVNVGGQTTWENQGGLLK